MRAPAAERGECVTSVNSLPCKQFDYSAETAAFDVLAIKHLPRPACVYRLGMPRHQPRESIKLNANLASRTYSSQAHIVVRSSSWQRPTGAIRSPSWLAG